jgi:hypothetical protein
MTAELVLSDDRYEKRAALACVEHTIREVFPAALFERPPTAGMADWGRCDAVGISVDVRSEPGRTLQGAINIWTSAMDGPKVRIGDVVLFAIDDIERSNLDH